MEYKNRNPRAAIYTLGCRVNQYESDAVEEELKSLGFDVLSFTDVCDVYIINTCAVTAESERKSRQMIRRAAVANPDAFILVMGCFSQIKAKEVAAITTKNGFVLLDETGKVLDKNASILKENVAVINNVNLKEYIEGEKVVLTDEKKTEALIKLFEAIKNADMQLLTEIDLKNINDNVQ
jgi:threonylcarbamoyladenosine tRNA methylthiotransferase MtaB